MSPLSPTRMLLMGAAVWLSLCPIRATEVELVVGLYGPLTSAGPGYAYSAVAADLDFKKQWNSTVRDLYGDPVVPVPNLNSSLRIKMVIGNSNSDQNLGVKTGLDFMVGLQGTYSKVNAIVGGYHSAISKPVASLAAVMETVQVSWGSTSPSLSDKASYPYFSRTIPPDSVQGKAFWGFMRFFGFRKASFIYADDGSYGFGMFEAVKSIATGEGKGAAIVAIPSKYMPTDFWDEDEAMLAIGRAKDAGHKLIMLCIYSINIRKYYDLFIREQLNAPHHVLLLSEAAQQVTDLAGVDGVFGWAPVSRGPRWASFRKLFANMSRADINDHLSDYHIDEWVAQWPGATGELPPDSFTEAGADQLVLEHPFIFDAFYTVVVAMNKMLNEGTSADEIRGSALLNEVRNVDFEGISGRVKYDEVGDRLADYELNNGRAHNGMPLGWTKVAVYSAADDTVTLLNDPLPLWAPGVESVQPPVSFTSCPPGTRYAADLNSCVACDASSFSSSYDSASCSQCAAGSVPSAERTGCVLCSPGKHAPEAGLGTCQSCEAGMIADRSGFVRCAECEAGKTSNAMKTACTPCEPGFFAATARAPFCVPCQAGEVAEGAGSTRCRRCNEGTKSNANGTVCEDCLAGYYAAEGGLSECTACPPGKATPEPGSAVCTDCEVGRFQTASGMTGCRACSDGGRKNPTLWTTLRKVQMGGKDRWVPLAGSDSEEYCGCKPQDGEDDGALKQAGECVPCKEGLNCLGMEDYELKESYWSSEEDPLNIFRCSSTEQCPGGKPGEACAPNLVGRSCSQCRQGWIWNRDKCVECADVEKSAFLFPVLPLLLGPIVVIVLYRFFGDTYEKWGSPQNGMASVVFILLNHYQIVIILGGVSMHFPVSVATFIDGFSFSSDVSTIFRPQCAGFASFQSNLIVKTLGPLILAVIFLGVWGASHVLGKLLNKPEIAMDANRTVNGFFSLIFTFFLGIAEMAMKLFKCGPNPNGTRTLLSDRSIICFDSPEWQGMLVIGIMAVLFWIFGFGGLFCRTVIVAPQWFHDRKVQMRWKFLFIKYRSDVHWWSLVIISKGILLNFGFVILVTAIAQIYWVIACLLAYTALVVAFRPWRHMLVNGTDIWTHLCLVLMASLLTWFARSSLEDHEAEALDKDMSRMVIASLVFCFAGALPALAQFVVMRTASYRDKRLQLIEEYWGTTERIAGADKDHFMDMMEKLGEWDLWFLEQAQHVVSTELLAHRSRSGLTTSIAPLRNSTISVMSKHSDKSTPSDEGDEGNGKKPQSMSLIIRAV